MTHQNTPVDLATKLRNGVSTASSIQESVIESRAGESSLLPTIVDEHPPGVPDEIAEQTPTATSRYHIVLPQGKEWESTRPHAVWHAYDGRVEAFEHPSAPDDTDWWFIMQKAFDGKRWLSGSSCVARNAEHTGKTLAAFLTGDQNAIRTARSKLPAHVTSSTKTTADTSTVSDHESAQNVLEEYE
jgi:hypothetical protein